MNNNQIHLNIVVDNKKEIDQLLSSLSKKYQINLSLPLSQLSAFNSSLNSINSSFAILSQNLNRISALLPNLNTLQELIIDLSKQLGPAYSPLLSLDNIHINNAIASLFSLKLLSQLSSASLATPATLPQNIGYLPSEQYSSPLDALMNLLQSYHSLPDLIESSLKYKSDDLLDKYHEDIENGFLYPCQIPLRENQLQDDILSAKSDSAAAHINILSQIYDLLQFWLPSYHDTKLQNIMDNAPLAHFADPENIQQYIDFHVSVPDSDHDSFNSSAFTDLVNAYHSEMAHLSSLRSLSLISYDDIIEKSWEYFRSLKAVANADGEVSQAEQVVLDLFLQRAQRAQLVKNREGADLTQYYNYSEKH